MGHTPVSAGCIPQEFVVVVSKTLKGHSLIYTA